MNETATILVVDDTAESLLFLVRLLSRSGYQVREATSGAAALASAAEQRPDLILLDLRLGDMSGLEVCRRLKAEARTSDVPIILVSGLADAEEWLGGLELGAADYVNKPFHISELLARVRTHLSLGRTLVLLKEKNAVIERANAELQSEAVARQHIEEKLRRSLEGADRSRLALLNALEDEKRAETRTRRANAFLDSIIENIPDMVLIRQASDLGIIRVNRAGENLLGMSRGDLVGRTAEQLFPSPQADSLESADRRVLASRTTVEVPDESVVTPKGLRVLHSKRVPILDPDGAPTHILGIFVDITEAKRAQDAILALSSRLKDILATVPEILMEVDNRWVYTWANAAGLRFFGEEVTDTPASQYHAGGPPGPDVAERALDGREEATYFENTQRRKDGARRLLAWWCRPLRDVQGKVRGALLSARDITESRKADEDKRRLEEQLRASQRMEAIGSLAGGVAHDFNNLLCVLHSYTEFAIRGVRGDDPVRDDLLAIKRAGERAAVLTRQLLAFGRKQVLQPVPLSLNDVVAGMEKMLRRILGEDIEFDLALAADLGVTRADRGQLEQVLMNLVANARDAMPDGGRLAIETRNVEIDAGFREVQGPLDVGPYVQVVVADTGCGMDELTLARIFDPFFTTKERGRGTGLGLSTVYGIVKQSRGGIWVASEVGRGTTFKVHLPRDLTAQPTMAAVTESLAPAPGNETVLLVEDEEDLRQVACRGLQASGYTVLSAHDGVAALEVAAQYPGNIHLLLTDVVMPNLGGRALAQQLRQSRPAMAILFMSGYTDDAIIRHGLLDAELQLIGKPFTVTALAQKVRDVLDRGKPGPRGSGMVVAPADAAQALRGGAPLPAENVVQLRRALGAARYDDMVAIVEQIQHLNPAVGAMLRERLEGFDYEGISKLLDENSAGATS